MKLLKYKKFQITLIIFLTFLVYINVFQNGFVGDDELYINTWEKVNHIENIPNFFSGHEFNDSHTRYRPLGSTYLAIMYQIWGKNPFGYHFTSLFMHLLTTLTVYFIAFEMIKDLPPKEGQVSSKIKEKKSLITTHSSLIPFLTALLFGLHPVQTETVNFVFTSIGLGYMFYFIAFLSYLKKHYIWSLLFACFAVFSYELTISFPLLVLFYELMKKKFDLHINYFKIAPFFGVIVMYAAIRLFLVHVSSVPHYLADSFYTTMLVMIKGFYWYIRIFLFPLDLSIIPQIGPGVTVLMDPFTNMGYLKSLSILDLEIFSKLAVLLTIVTVGIKYIKRYSLISFGIGWFFISLLPVSYIFPQDTAYQERYIYIGVFGCAIITGWIFYKLYSFDTYKSFATVILIIITIMLGWRTYLRNFDWRSSVAMWRKVVEQYPDNVVQNYVYAGHLEAAGNIQEALIQYEKVLLLEPRFIDLYVSIALIYYQQGYTQNAIVSLNRALSIKPDYQVAKDLLTQITDKKKKSR